MSISIISKNWMKDLPNLLVSEISIPGTHDSGCFLECGILQTQNWPIEKQLNNGIRFFDIRCRHVEDSFHIYHDSFDCEIPFETLIQTCKNFLNKYPSECLVMRIKEENSPLNCSRKFKETFYNYLNKNKDLFHMDESVPLLNQIRKKIWVLCEFECSEVEAYKWNKVSVQDFWDLNTYSVPQKVSHIENHVSLTNSGKRNDLFINFFSGVGDTLWPKDLAEIVNKGIFKFKGRLGAIAFDFPNRSVINHVIKQNQFVNTSKLNFYGLTPVSQLQTKPTHIIAIAFKVIFRMKFYLTTKATSKITSAPNKSSSFHKRRRPYKMFFIFHIFMILKTNNFEIENFLKYLRQSAQICKTMY